MVTRSPPAIAGRPDDDTRVGARILGTADWLCLGAAPTFAVMALLTGILDDKTPDLLCATHHASPFAGMATMYALMSLFHVAPWLKLASRRRGP